MINAQELRIGNKVYGQKDCIFTVLEIMACGITYDCDHQCAAHAEWDEIKPIPLSPDLLERCGFVEIEDEEDSSGWNRPGMANSGNFIIWNFDGTLALDGYSDAPLNYVHQLQNLFYALTGHELQYIPNHPLQGN